ncbi:hypothetical protein GCM10022294_09040 [Dietzia aurantiaca]
MIVAYSTNKLRKTCASSRLLKKEFNEAVGKAVERRLTQLRAVECMEDLTYLTGRWHPLSADRAGEWAASLTPNWRIIVVPRGDDEAEVVRIEDYH